MVYCCTVYSLLDKRILFYLRLNSMMVKERERESSTDCTGTHVQVFVSNSVSILSNALE